MKQYQNVSSESCYFNIRKNHGKHNVKAILGVLMVAGTFVYWWITQEEMGEYSDHFGLDASFAICVIAGASSLATGFLRILIERKRKFSRYGSRMAKRQQSIRRTVCGNTSATNIALVLLSQQAEIDRQRSLPKIPPGTNGSHIDTLTKHSVVPNVHCY